MAEEKIFFDKKFALKNWQKRYPIKEERVEVLARELEDCRSKPNRYPNTIRHIEEMLEELGVAA